MIRPPTRPGFKYVWVTEHHFLDEYSHLSANDVVLGYLAHATERIHLGSGIFNPLPQVNHPAKVAERVAMLDHLSDGRFEFGTGRGAGSHEILGFLPGMRDLTHTREIWEDVIGEFPKMWMQDEYEGYEGKYWSLPPRKILPKPYTKPHPPCGTPPATPPATRWRPARASACSGFSVGDHRRAGAGAQGLQGRDRQRRADRRVRERQRDGHDGGLRGRGPQEARRRSAIDAPLDYLQSNVFRYHDTFPHPDEVPTWPELHPRPDARGDPSACVDGGHDLRRPRPGARRSASGGRPPAPTSWSSASGTATHEDTLETIRLMGEHVIPKIDTDPVHRTTRFRDAAAAKVS